jgi:pimeloyl-ACP methyl ester carboxylesterase
MTAREHAGLFGSCRSLVGVVTEGQSAPGDRPMPLPAAIFLNAGVIHRVGPSRLYVGIARRLSALGWSSARFDHSGIGDSPVRRDGKPFEQSAILEVREVMDSLEQHRGIDRFVLIGLCSGAVTAFDAAVADPRVVGAVLINPQGFDDGAAWNAYVQNRGHARRYWTRSLFSASSWWNALTGRVDYGRLFRVLLGQVVRSRESEDAVKSVVSRVASDLRTLVARGCRLLLLCSEGDDGIDYMNVILGQDIRSLSAPGLDVTILTDADHSFTLRASQRRILEAIHEWAAASYGETGAAAPAYAVTTR